MPPWASKHRGKKVVQEGYSSTESPCLHVSSYCITSSYEEETLMKAQRSYEYFISSFAL